MEFVFRKLDPDNPEDIRQFNELMDELSCQAENQELLRERIRDMNGKEDRFLMAAEEKGTGRLCGSLMAVIFEDFCSDLRPIMVIENVVSGRRFRRQGVGRAMFSAIEDWGRERQVKYAILCSGLKRKQAHSFYEAIGYSEIKGFKKYL